MKFFFGHGGMAMEKQPAHGSGAKNAVLKPKLSIGILSLCINHACIQYWQVSPFR
jgi:hypothetical protein